MGNRLVKFVSRVLPTHKHYFSNNPKRIALRCQSQSQLVQLLQYLEELALIIDEEEYQNFNQERNMLSGEEAQSYDDSSDEVSSFGDNGRSFEETFAEGPSFAASDSAPGVTYESHDFQAFEEAKSQDEPAQPSLSRIRLLQNQESKSWDQAFFNQIAPQIPEFEPSQSKTQNFFPEDATSDLEFSFPSDFHTAPNGERQEAGGHLDTSTSSQSFTVEFSNTVDFTSSVAWPEQYPSNVWTHQDQRQGPDSSFSDCPERYRLPQKMTLRPKALYGSQVDREYSPKSVLELPEFMPESKVIDEHFNSSTMVPSGSVDVCLQRVDMERPSPSDDCLSALSGEEEELSLTGAPMRRRRRTVHFKGCVRCLLE